MKTYTIVVVDDYVLLGQAIANLVNSFEGFKVAYICTSGKDFLDRLNSSNKTPDIVLMDISMPILNGIETTKLAKKAYPDLKILALTLIEDETSIIEMLKAGANGYLLKDIESNFLKSALKQVIEEGYFYTRRVSNLLVNAISNNNSSTQLNNRELEFITYSCSELTYNEIADKMFRSPKTIDGYRDSIFRKLNVKNRIGLVLYAIKHKIYTP